MNSFSFNINDIENIHSSLSIHGDVKKVLQGTVDRSCMNSLSLSTLWCGLGAGSFDENRYCGEAIAFKSKAYGSIVHFDLNKIDLYP